MKKSLLNNNLVVLLQDIQDSIREGYRIVPSKTFLGTSFSLYEIDLYKEDVPIREIKLDEELDEVVVENYDANKWLLELQNYIVNDYAVCLNSVVYIDTNIKRCVVKKANHPATQVFSLDQLRELSYEELKEVARYRGCFNRSKEQMIKNIIRFQESKQ